MNSDTKFLRNHLSQTLSAALLVLSLCGLHAQAVPAPVSASTSPHPFASVFQPLVDNHVMAGAVFLIANKDQVLDEETVGYADIEANKPMSTHNEFWIASMTKPLTAVALMMLVDEGKVSIDDPVEKYLPEFKGQMVQGPSGGPPVAASHPILIREILSHTSGMPNLPDDFATPLAERVKGYGHTPLASQPGTKFVYVNAGINTVGRIVEVVSGKPYEQFLQERILTPLGMTDTTFWPSEKQLARLASAYQATPDGKGLLKAPRPLTPLPGEPRLFAFPAGGLFSTAEDMLKFCRMMLQGGTYKGKRYISPQSIASMTRAYTTPATGGSYGLGWMITSNAFGHDGAFKTRMTIVPSEGLVEIFMVQLAKPLPDGADDVMRIFSKTAEQTFGHKPVAVNAPPNRNTRME